MRAFTYFLAGFIGFSHFTNQGSQQLTNGQRQPTTHTTFADENQRPRQATDSLRFHIGIAHHQDRVGFFAPTKVPDKTFPLSAGLL